MTTLWLLYTSVVTMDLVRCSLHLFFQVLPEPWSCVIPTQVSSQMWPSHLLLQDRYYLSLIPVLSQHWPDQDRYYTNTFLSKIQTDQDCWASTSFLVCVMGWSWNSFTRWQAPSILALVGVSPSGTVLGYSENYQGFRVLAPFTPPLLKCNCQHLYYNNWTKKFCWSLSRRRTGVTHPQCYL